ncbi:hypothetical protein PCIT_a1320 [Pseudoalteromonas citrea]|uniref:histidine kinase n=2 Tax=Pseudoalteromonas citrea TaxID=43655 RepID=A0AAD4AME6_9GAMM|nr:ATP-binding protein [Pseudoalteromonas citrea]KAF7775188.1 hypothetical protein PCIT_a1320 [Pseudoalteromonas citrea]
MVRENKTTTAELPCGQIGSTLEKIKLSIHPDDFKQLEEAFDNHLKGNCEFYEVSYRVLTQAGHWLWVLDRGKVTLRSENGLAQRISGTVKDISVLKASELALSELNNNLEQKVEERTTSLKESRDALATTIDELQTMQSTLIESQKMASIGKLVVGISHELNTPLGISVTAVSLLIEKLQSFQNKFLENQLTRSDTKDFVETSLSSVQLLDSNISRAAQLVKRFKQVSVSEHIQSSRTINLNELINTFLSMHCELEGVTISINCSKDLHAQCDAHALVNVLNELYQNSIQHGFNSPSTGKISIQLEKIGDQIKLTFSDSGKGVHEKNMPHLFEPFFTTTRHNGNAGLGLYLVYSNVTHILRGQISFQTVELEGISFEIYFPVFNDSPN